MILVDTSIWSLALRRRRADLNETEHRHVREWQRLVREAEATLIGPIRQELLSGVRGERAWERLRSALRPFPDLPLTTPDYERASQFFNRCRARGITGSAVDLMICSASVRYQAPIYTTDPDFRHYAQVLGLMLHEPPPNHPKPAR
ncbi:MAG: PIN domain-containing protein [Salinisphaera sp.]|nr:PIN domain-containing protein [Salinisphaera sp.]